MRKDEMRKDGMRNEGLKIPGCIADPISEPLIEGLISNPECFGEPCKACVIFCLNPSIPFFTQLAEILIIRDWLLMAPPTSCLKVQKKTRLDASHQLPSTCQHDGPINAFPEHISTSEMPVTLPEKPDALEYAAR
ncbi:hypothetical protein TNCV_1519691 [Trichonephila clavipes]|nr:hypothetical protein TNCV_1519691 [Trichonephila clavipes]